MSNIKLFETPTANLRFCYGVLQQQWRITFVDQDTEGKGESDIFEWRNVEDVSRETKMPTEVAPNIGRCGVSSDPTPGALP